VQNQTKMYGSASYSAVL